MRRLGTRSRRVMKSGKSRGMEEVREKEKVRTRERLKRSRRDG